MNRLQRLLNWQSSVAFAADPGGGSSGGAMEIIESGVQGGGIPGGGGGGGPAPFGSEESDDAALADVFKMFNPDPDEGDDPPADPSNPDDTSVGDLPPPAEIPADRVQAVENDVKAAIGKMKFPSNLFPADFDPSNREQMQTVMDGAVRAAVAQTMSVVFKPVQMALQHTIQQLEARTDAKLAQGTDRAAARQIMETVVPEINDPKYSGMIRTMDENLRKVGRKPQQRAQAIRKMLNQMGITPAAGGARRGGGEQPGSTMRQGKAALDSFFGQFDPNALLGTQQPQRK